MNPVMRSNPTEYSGRTVRTKSLRTVIVISAFLLALLYGRHVLATTYAIYDDEGYMLLSFVHYFAGEHLYTHVSSEYGPFNFFVERSLFQSLHLPVTHDAGRLITLICWLLSAALGGYFTFRLSKNATLAAAAGLATMFLGRILSHEPGHPQQLILPLLMLACCVSLSTRKVNLLVLGALGAALFFIKINVGVFYFAGAAQVLVCQFRAGRTRNVCAGFLLVFLVCGPLLLMRQDLQGWARNYCLLAIVCSVSTLVMAFVVTPPAPEPTRDVVYVAAGAVSTAGLIVAETIREGMSMSALAEGVFWGPLRHPRVFQLPFWASTTNVLAAVVVSVCFIGLYCIRDRWPARADLLDGLRCVTGLFVIAMLMRTPPAIIVLPLLPLGLIPIKGRPWQLSDLFPRLFVTSLVAAQFPQAYPVAGSQTSIAIAPMLLWAFTCIYDGSPGLFSLVSRAKSPSETGPHRQGSRIDCLLACAVVALLVLGIWHWRHVPPSSSLRGAASLHLPAWEESRYESLSRDIEANCSMLFTMPGMGSLNFWSGVPTPNGLNLPSWTRAFSVEQQQQILELLEKNPRSCVVYSEEVAQLRGLSRQELVNVPLAHHILFDLRKVHEQDGYMIFANPRRDSPWIEAGSHRSP
jgi:hypothetical protein